MRKHIEVGVGGHELAGALFHALLQLFVEVAHHVFQVLGHRHVALDARQRLQLARVVPQRGDDGVPPEARAVLAHAPPARLPLASLQRLLQGVGGRFFAVQGGHGAWLGQQGLQGLAQHLIAGKAVQALGAFAPLGDGALLVHEEDAGVLQGVGHQPEAPFAGLQLGGALLHPGLQRQIGAEDDVFGDAPVGDVVELDEEAANLALALVGHVVHLVEARGAIGLAALGLKSLGFTCQGAGDSPHHFGQHLGRHRLAQVHAHQGTRRQAVVIGLRAVGKTADKVFVVIDQTSRGAVGDVLQELQLGHQAVLGDAALAHVGQHRFNALDGAAGVAHHHRIHLCNQPFATRATQAQLDRGCNAAVHQHVQVNAQQIRARAIAQAQPGQQIGAFGGWRLGPQPVAQGLVHPRQATGQVKGQQATGCTVKPGGGFRRHQASRQYQRTQPNRTSAYWAQQL